MNSKVIDGFEFEINGSGFDYHWETSVQADTAHGEIYYCMILYRFCGGRHALGVYVFAYDVAGYDDDDECLFEIESTDFASTSAELDRIHGDLIARARWHALFPVALLGARATRSRKS